MAAVVMQEHAACNAMQRDGMGSDHAGLCLGMGWDPTTRDCVSGWGGIRSRGICLGMGWQWREATTAMARGEDLCMYVPALSYNLAAVREATADGMQSGVEQMTGRS